MGWVITITQREVLAKQLVYSRKKGQSKLEGHREYVGQVVGATVGAWEEKLVHYKAQAEQAVGIYTLQFHVLLSHWSLFCADICLVPRQISFHSKISALSEALP